MMDNKLIERAMEYVQDEVPWNPSKIIIEDICSARKDTRTGMAHYWQFFLCSENESHVK
jgi:hypothetical protein